MEACKYGPRFTEAEQVTPDWFDMVGHQAFHPK
jgi:hypothetical protein